MKKLIFALSLVLSVSAFAAEKSCNIFVDFGNYEVENRAIAASLVKKGYTVVNVETEADVVFWGYSMCTGDDNTCVMRVDYKLPTGESEIVAWEYDNSYFGNAKIEKARKRALKRVPSCRAFKKATAAQN